MNKFKRKATLEEIKSECEKRGWTLHTKIYDQGGDGVSFRFKIGRVSGMAVINMFNGKIIGQLDNGKHFSDTTKSKFENTRWFKTLLTIAYKN